MSKKDKEPGRTKHTKTKLQSISASLCLECRGTKDRLHRGHKTRGVSQLYQIFHYRDHPVLQPRCRDTAKRLTRGGPDNIFRARGLPPSGPPFPPCNNVSNNELERVIKGSMVERRDGKSV